MFIEFLINVPLLEGSIAIKNVGILQIIMQVFWPCPVWRDVQKADWYGPDFTQIALTPSSVLLLPESGILEAYTIVLIELKF